MVFATRLQRTLRTVNLFSNSCCVLLRGLGVNLTVPFPFQAAVQPLPLVSVVVHRWTDFSRRWTVLQCSYPRAFGELGAPERLLAAQTVRWTDTPSIWLLASTRQPDVF